MLPTGFWVFGCFRGERLALLGNILVLMILLPGNDHVLAQNGVVPQCYFPNQEIAIDNYACVLSSSNSACCGIGNVCLDNGLCAPGNGEIIRGACTDQTWRSAACPQYCLQADTGGTDLINCQNVTSNARDYCCDHTNDCCDTGVGRFRLDSAGTPVATIRSSASTATRELSSLVTPLRRTTSISVSSKTSTTTAPTSTPAGASEASPSPAPVLSSGLSGGAKAGIGVGAALGAIIALGFVLWLWRWRRGFARRSRPDASQKSNPPVFKSHELSGERHHELAGEHAQEMSASRPVGELPAENNLSRNGQLR